MIRRQKRKADIRRRVANPKNANPGCSIFGCRLPTTAASRAGLNRLFCQRHVDQYRRHGSYYRLSYRVSDLAPYRAAALRWLKEHNEDPMVAAAVSQVERLYRRAGEHVEAFRLAGKPPSERAQAAWARLRTKAIDPLRPLAAWLATELILLDDPQAERSPEYRRVQAAKLVHRLASGSHKRWERQDARGRKLVTELHKYPANRGQVLRHLGEQLEGAARELVAAHLSAIQLLKVSRRYVHLLD